MQIAGEGYHNIKIIKKKRQHELYIETGIVSQHRISYTKDKVFRSSNFSGSLATCSSKGLISDCKISIKSTQLVLEEFVSLAGSFFYSYNFSGWAIFLAIVLFLFLRVFSITAKFINIHGFFGVSVTSQVYRVLECGVLYSAGHSKQTNPSVGIIKWQ